MTDSSQAPAITLVQSMLSKAIAQHASDIHLESVQGGLRIRFRIDGFLYDEPLVHEEHALQVLSRLKVLAHMDVAERRIPQDGKFDVNVHSKSVDIRVSTFPTFYGEKIVLRILDRTYNMLHLDVLGFTDQMQNHVKQLIDTVHGFFLVVGPTGSGKTTTLYSLLSYIQSSEKNCVTLEDPIEYTLDGIMQSQVHPEIGFTFEAGIRSLLRQDPDIIMVGEVRDRDTARTALQAALTGHLVMSTVHTQDAPSTIMRLLDMRIEPYLLNAALTGVLSQRLARKLCDLCKKESELSSHDSALIKRYNLPIDTAFKAVGCDGCHQGYKGRTGIFELLVATPALRSIITERPSIDELYRQAHADGLQPMLIDAAQKINSGVIDLHELARVLL